MFTAHTNSSTSPGNRRQVHSGFRNRIPLWYRRLFTLRKLALPDYEWALYWLVDGFEQW